MNLSYMAGTPGIGGALKSKPEDFLVEEILEDGGVLELNKPFSLPDSPGEFVHFVLQKRNWTTARALKEAAGRLHVGERRLNCAGNKDRTAITAQRASAFAVEKEKLLSLRLKDIKILGAWTASDKVRMGQLAGNRFTIRADGCDDNPERVQKIYDELDGATPNYFGEQRFGSSRKNTHLVGEKILKGDAREAVEMYLTDSAGEENPEAVAARKRLSEEWDHKKALAYYPRSLTHERTLLAQLARNPSDHVGALRRLPRSILLLFVHAFQSHVFNLMLSERVRGKDFTDRDGEYLCGENAAGFPDPEIKADGKKGRLCMKIIGYDTTLNEAEKELLAELDVNPEMFRCRSIPEISSEGTYRTALAPLKGFSYKDRTFRFSLQSGAYATSALREFLDVKR